MDFLKHLTPEQRAKIEWRRAAHERDVAEHRALSDEELLEKVTYCLKNSEFVHRYQPGEPVYDGAMAHVMIPELTRRLSCEGKGCGTDQNKACLRCCRILLNNYDANHGTYCDAEQERLHHLAEEALNANVRLRRALEVALAVWCPRDPGGDGADGETYRLVKNALAGKVEA